jgi:choice-of-anchor C domain-containing protein
VRRLFRLAPLALLALAPLTCPPLAQANIVADGSFETPSLDGGSRLYGAGDSFDGWMVGSGTIDHLGTFWQAAAGSQSIDLNGNDRGSVYQDLATVSGGRYRLRFATAGNADSVFPCPQGTVVTSVTWEGSEVARRSFDTTGRTEKTMGWQYLVYELTAAAATSRLQFASVSPSGFCGPTLDDVRVDVIDLPTPVLGKQVNAAVVSGKVLVAVPARGGRAQASEKGLKFVPLTDPRQIPTGSFLDASKGTVGLTSATGTGAETQSAQFSSGIFQVLQSRKKRDKGLTELRLRGSSFKRCNARRGKRASAAGLSSRTIRKLKGDAKGRYRTRGRHSAATVRGTIWTVADRCDGTLTSVKRGRVAVRDFRRKKTVVVGAGKSYLARARA